MERTGPGLDRVDRVDGASSCERQRRRSTTGWCSRRSGRRGATQLAAPRSQSDGRSSVLSACDLLVVDAGFRRADATVARRPRAHRSCRRSGPGRRRTRPGMRRGLRRASRHCWSLLSDESIRNQPPVVKLVGGLSLENARQSGTRATAEVRRRAQRPGQAARIALDGVRHVGGRQQTVVGVLLEVKGLVAVRLRTPSWSCGPVELIDDRDRLQPARRDRRAASPAAPCSRAPPAVPVVPPRPAVLPPVPAVPVVPPRPAVPPRAAVPAAPVVPPRPAVPPATPPVCRPCRSCRRGPPPPTPSPRRCLPLRVTAPPVPAVAFDAANATDRARRAAAGRPRRTGRRTARAAAAGGTRGRAAPPARTAVPACRRRRWYLGRRHAPNSSAQPAARCKARTRTRLGASCRRGRRRIGCW